MIYQLLDAKSCGLDNQSSYHRALGFLLESHVTNGILRNQTKLNSLILILGSRLHILFVSDQRILTKLREPWKLLRSPSAYYAELSGGWSAGVAAQT